MTCDRRDDVAAWLLGGASADEALEIEHHVLGCDDCARTRRELSIVRSLLDTLPDEPLVEEPNDLRESVVASMVRTRQSDRRRDVGMALLGAAAAALLIGIASFVFLRGGDRGNAPAAQEMQLVSPSAAPGAWALVNLHPRVEGTIVDLEAGDLPTDGATYVLRVKAAGEVLAEQPFTVSSDGWAQVVAATDRPIGPTDVIEVARVQGNGSQPVLRCNCSA